MNRIRAIMRSDVAITRPDMPIRQAVALLVDSGQSVLPVTEDDGRLIGVLSQKDCFRPALHAGYHQVWTGKVADYMTHGAVTIGAEDEAVHAAEVFLETRHRVLPVLDGGRLAGLLDRGDVLALLARIG